MVIVSYYNPIIGSNLISILIVRGPSQTYDSVLPGKKLRRPDFQTSE